MSKKEVKILINAHDNASRKIKAIVGTVAGLFASAAIKSTVQNTIDAADAIGKGAKRIQVTTDEYQKLAHASRLAGADQSVVESAFKRMSTVVRDAGMGLKDAKDSLKDLGLTFEDLKGKSTYEQFDILTRAVQGSNNQLALAQKVFGRSGQQLLPFIDGFRAAGDELERLGTMLDTKTIEAAENFNDSMTKLYTNIQAGVANSGLIEWLDDVTDRLVTTQAAAGGFKWNFVAAVEDALPGVGALRKAVHGESANETLDRLQKKRLAGINRKTFKNPAPVSTPGGGGNPETTAAEINKLLDGAISALELQITAEEQIKQLGKDQIESLRQQIELTNLRNAGKEREAAIQQEINAAVSRGIEDDKQLAEIRRLAGIQFDMADAKSAGRTPGSTAPTGPQSAMVLRSLSGLSTASKPLEKTAQNTADAVASLVAVETLLAGIQQELKNSRTGTATL